MKDEALLPTREFFQSVNFFALVVGAGITVGGEDDADGGVFMPLGLYLIEFAVDGCFEQRQQIAFEPHHDRLALGIAEAGVEFDDLRSLLGNHQAA